MWQLKTIKNKHMKIFTIIILFLLQSYSATPYNKNAAQEIKTGNRFYKNGQWIQAAEAYTKAINSSHRYIAMINKGNALYRQNKYDEAIQLYKQTASNANSDIRLRSEANYNSGVAYSSQKKIEESIEAYKNTLRLNWKDSDARENLQKAFLALQKQSESEKNNDNKNEKPIQQSKTDINKTRAEQQLDRLEKKEKQTQQRMSRRKNGYEGSAGKDW
jgi:tetratricopeptide (TPR) repeat protein